MKITQINKNEDPNKFLRRAADDLVWMVFNDRIYHGVITISREEMRNVFINLLAEFIDFRKAKK
jgi:hypothetical protein